MTRPETRRPAPAPALVPGWVPAASLLLAVAGLAVAGYLTVEHYTASTTLACPETGVVNCQKVTTSPQSAVAGVPVVLLGLIFFAVLLPACLPVAWRSTRRWLRLGRLGFTLSGVGFVVYLIYTELFTLGAICLWCTAVHAITLALFAVVALGSALEDPAG
jgi:uncharacterized membrane protein